MVSPLASDVRRREGSTTLGLAFTAMMVMSTAFFALKRSKSLAQRKPLGLDHIPDDEMNQLAYTRRQVSYYLTKRSGDDDQRSDTVVRIL